MEAKDLSQVYVVVRGDVYNKVINFLANNFSYAQIMGPMEDLKSNAFEVDKSVVIAFDKNAPENLPVVSIESLEVKSSDEEQPNELDFPSVTVEAPVEAAPEPVETASQEQPVQPVHTSEAGAKLTSF
jgi:hypothetical protein